MKTVAHSLLPKPLFYCYYHHLKPWMGVCYIQGAPEKHLWFWNSRSWIGIVYITFLPDSLIKSIIHVWINYRLFHTNVPLGSSKLFDAEAIIIRCNCQVCTISESLILWATYGLKSSSCCLEGMIARSTSIVRDIKKKCVYEKKT